MLYDYIDAIKERLRDSSEVVIRIDVPKACGMSAHCMQLAHIFTRGGY